MNLDEDYRPANVEFDVAEDGSIMPLNMGSFDSLEDCMKMIGGNMTVINHAITVGRHMDFVEKNHRREIYNDVLENTLPKQERNHSLLTRKLEEAKKEEKEAKEMVNASINEARILAAEVKRGIIDVKLDDIATVRIPYNGRYYFYTYMDKQLKLCKIADIMDSEKQELYTAMANNEAFLESQYGEESITDVDFEETNVETKS